MGFIGGPAVWQFYESEINGTDINNAGSESAADFDTISSHVSVNRHFALWFSLK